MARTDRMGWTILLFPDLEQVRLNLPSLRTLGPPFTKLDKACLAIVIPRMSPIPPELDDAFIARRTRGSSLLDRKSDALSVWIDGNDDNVDEVVDSDMVGNGGDEGMRDLRDVDKAGAMRSEVDESSVRCDISDAAGELGARLKGAAREGSGASAGARGQERMRM